MKPASGDVPPARGSSDGLDVDRLVEAQHADLDVDEAGRIAFEGITIGRLVRGRDLTTPDAVVTRELGAGARLRVGRRLVAFARDLVADLLAPLRPPKDAGPAAAGAHYATLAGLGTWVHEGRAALDDAARAALSTSGLVVGSFSVFSAELLRPRSVARRRVLARAFFDETSASARLPSGKEVSVRRDPTVLPRLYAALGYACVGTRAIRVDILERLFGPPLEDETGREAARVLGCSPRDGQAVLAALTQPSQS